MMLTALQCYEEGIVYAAVHDSYWCHPSDVDRMGQILRDQFIQLHSQPLIDKLEENFKSRYPNEKFPKRPPSGELDLNDVRHSTYFFS